MSPSTLEKPSSPAPTVDLAQRESRVGRPADRQDVIVETLRDRIVTGELSVGNILPTRAEIQRTFEASPVTVQRALERLKRDGYVTATRGNGTFVSSQAPHLSRFGLVFPLVPDPYEGWNNFHEALARVADEITEGGLFRVPKFFDVNGYEDSQDYRQLLDDVREQRLAGLLFVSLPNRIRRAPLVRQRELPCLVVGSSDCGTAFPMVRLDPVSFVNKALDRLQSLGCKKVASVVPPGLEEWRPMMEEGIARRGMETRRHWWQISSRGMDGAPYQLMLLLFNDANTDKPDALVLWDDNMVESATLGLVDAGAHDVQVIAHCNYPLPPKVHLPVQRLGFDAREIIGRSIEVMSAQNAGTASPEQVLIEARYEEELTR